MLRYAVKQAGGQGEMTATVTGTNKEKLVIGKLDPPAAFNLEDIQNLPGSTACVSHCF